VKRPDPACKRCGGTGRATTFHQEAGAPCSCLHEGLTDVELVALAALVQVHALENKTMEDYMRAVGCNDAGIVNSYVHGAQELQAELERRGVL